MTEAEEFEFRRRRELELSHGSATAPTGYPEQPLGNRQEEFLIQAQTAFPGVTGVRGVGFGTQAQEGLLSDTFEERQKFYKEKYPNYEQKVISVRTQPYIAMRDPDTNELVVPNQPGVDRGDFARMLGAAAPAAATTAAVALSGGGIVPLMAGAGLSELGREAGQAAYGSQAEPLSDYLTRAAVYSAAEIPGALVAGAGTGAVNAMTRRQTPGSMAFKDDVIAAQRGVEAGLPPTDWMRYQFSQNPMMKRTQRQTQQLSQPMQAFHSDQMQAIREGAEATIPRGGTMPPDAAVQQGMKDAFGATRAREFPPVDATVGGKRLVGYVDRGIKAQRETVSSLYDDVRASVQAEAPVLSLKGPKELATQRSVPAVAADGTPIDLRKPPTGEYKAVLDDIAALPDTATYDQVQELRSRVGRLQNMDPARLAESNADTADLVRMDAALAETLRTPVNDAPGYVSALSKASDARKELGVLQKLDGVRKAARAKKTEQWNKLFNSLATSPDALEPRLLSAIDKAGPRNANAYRQTILGSIAASDDPLATWSRLQQKGGEGFEWLTKNPGVRETMDTVVRAAKEINSSQFKEAWDRATIKSGFAQEALEKTASDGASSRSLVSQLGGRGSEGHEALRTAIYERAIQRSIGRNESAGVDAIDPKALGASIKEMKDKRWWSEILTKEDQAKLEGLLAQSRLSWQGGGLGDGLVIASLARKIFSLQAHEAVSEIGASRMFARLLMNKSYNKNALPKAAARLQTTGKPAFSGDWPRAIATTMTSLGLNYPATE